MKSTKELLEIILALIKKSGEGEFNGICHTIMFAGPLFAKIISFEQEEILYRYLKANRPKHAAAYGFWWNIGDMKPRIKWLKKHIQLMS